MNTIRQPSVLAPSEPNLFLQKLNRRQALGRLSAGVLLSLGLWPGALSVQAKGGGKPFRFVVVNDTHYLSSECGDWLTGVVRQMKQEQPEFCLLAGDLTERGERDHLASVRDIFRELGVPTYVQIGNHDYLVNSAGNKVVQAGRPFYAPRDPRSARGVASQAATRTVYSPGDRRFYEQLYPRRLNYWFEHSGWQFVGLDSTQGLAYEKTQIQPHTLSWVDSHLRRLDKKKPTVIFTHFPLGEKVKYRPANADALLERFREFNLQAVFCGHFHGFTERQVGATTFTTNKCCALKRGNHDNTKEKGFFVCTAADGRISRRFVECKMDLPAARSERRQ